MAREFVSGGCMGTASTQYATWGPILMTTNPITAAMLFKLRGDGSGNYDVVWGHSNENWFFILSGASGSRAKLAFSFASSGGEKSSGFLTNNLTLNTWYMIIATHDSAGGADNTTIAAYTAADGVLVERKTATNAFSISAGQGKSLIAGYDVIRLNAVNAQFKNFKVWSRVLTVPEQDALAANQPVDRINLELETLCNETAGTTLRDSASISNRWPATMINSPVMSPSIPAPFARARVLNN